MAENPPPVADVPSSGDDPSSPLSRRQSLPSPWASVVREDSEQNSSPMAVAAAVAPGISLSTPPDQISGSDISLIESSGGEAQPESADATADSNAGRARRPAWNRPVDGVVEPASVMGGAVSWPALSETTRPVLRPSLDNSRPISDGSASSSQTPILSPPPQRPGNDNAHVNSTPNNPMPSRPRSRNRNGGSSSGFGLSQNNFNQPSLQMPPPFPYGMIPAVVDTPVRGPRSVGGGLGGPQSHTGNDHPPRNNSRRGGYGSRPRGDGQYQVNHGGRRDQCRRDVHHPPPGPPQYLPPMGYGPSPLPHGLPPYVGPAPVRVFPGQMGYDMVSPFIYYSPMSPESFRAVPIVPPPAPVLYPPANDNPLTDMIVKQIDFYFSDDNLVKDNFLRTRMDDQGWVPITLIASFRRVQQLTRDIPLILESLRYSTVVEVQGDMVRRRHEWRKWLRPAGWPNSDSGAQTPLAPESEVAASFQGVSLDGSRKTNIDGSKNANEVHNEVATARELIGHSGFANGEDTDEEVHTISV